MDLKIRYSMGGHGATKTKTFPTTGLLINQFWDGCVFFNYSVRQLRLWPVAPATTGEKTHLLWDYQ